MNQESSFLKCDEANIQRITTLVDAKIQASNELNEIHQPHFFKHRSHIKKLILVATLTLLSLSSLAFAANIDLPELIRQAYHQLFPNEVMADKALDYMVPLEGSCTFNGIKAEMIGYIRDNDVVYLTFSLQDLEGDRLDETTFIYDYSIDGYDSDIITPSGSNAVFGFNGGINILYTSPINMPEISLVHYESTTKTAIFNYRFSNHDAVTFLEDGSREFYKALQLTINLIASGAKEGESSIHLETSLTDPNYKPSTLQADFDDFRRMGYTGASKQLQTFLTPDKCRGTLLSVPGVYISNFGIIDNRLHILIKYERPRDVSINCVLDMTLKSSQKVWDAESERYLKDGYYTGTVCRFKTNNAYYAEYIFTLPDGYTPDDLEVLYHYRTYDYVIGMDDNDFINLPDSEMEQALWQLNFSPSITLEEHSIPFQLVSDNHVLEETTGYISALGLMIPKSPNTYAELYYSTFKQNMPLTVLLSDGSSQTLYINSVEGYTKPDNQTGKTKLLFSEFVDITTIKSITLTLP